jgi:hypothetical protein
MLDPIRLSAIAAVALTAFPVLHAQDQNENGATKNEVDLSFFQGNYFGKSIVTANGNTLRGRGIVRAKISDDLVTGRINIKGNVRVRGERVPIDNRFTFRETGRVDVQEIAPAVSNGQKSKGFYNAIPRSLRFVGQFNLDADRGRIAGTYECVIRISVKRIVRMTYTVTLEDDPTPSFVYRIVAEPREDEDE